MQLELFNKSLDKSQLSKKNNIYSYQLSHIVN